MTNQSRGSRQLGGPVAGLFHSGPPLGGRYDPSWVTKVIHEVLSGLPLLDRFGGSRHRESSTCHRLDMLGLSMKLMMEPQSAADIAGAESMRAIQSSAHQDPDRRCLSKIAGLGLRTPL